MKRRNMQLHQIKRKNKNKSKKRIGRGGKRGSYSGKGIKGQKSRAGKKLRPELRDIIKKIPKKRGYRFKSFVKKPKTINLNLIEKHFESGQKVTPKSLLEKGLIEKKKGFLPDVKLLGGGILTKKLLVSKCQISKPALEKIKKAGGNVE
ncbi:MAG: uL15 family ribosomal protein [Patescibacteria group bacterium]